MWTSSLLKQKYSSKNTAIRFPNPENKKPKIFSLYHKGKINLGIKNLDIGSGKTWELHRWLKNRGIDNYQYDPYNLPHEVSETAIRECSNGQCDTATISNVLCVIKEQEIRLDVLKMAYDSLKEDGICYISIYNSNKKGETCNGWQNGKPKEWYLPEILSVFNNYEIKHGIIITKKYQPF